MHIPSYSWAQKEFINLNKNLPTSSQKFKLVLILLLWYFSNISKWRFHFNYFVIVSFPSTLVFNQVFLIWLKNISILDLVQSTIVQKCQVFYYRTTFPALFWRSSLSNNFQFFLQLSKL